MNLKESITMGFKQLLSNKGRTFLTMLGMFIGVGSVIMILALGAGIKDSTMKSFSDIGLGAFQINIKDPAPHLRMTPEDFEVIRAIPEVELIIGTISASGSVLNKQGEAKRVSLFGAEPEINTVQKIDLLMGRLHTERDKEVAAKVVIISDLYAKLILRQTDYKNVIGKAIEVTMTDQTQSFEIIGVYKSNMPSNTPQQYQEQSLPGYPMHIPITTMDIITKSAGNVSQAYGIIEDGHNQKEITNQIRLLLNRRHQQKDTYNVSSAADMIDTVNQMLNMITLFISAVAGISLLVGGVGIMNIMLVTVKERTREIGVRKALGASNKVILRQFLIEALILTIVAGTIGMLLGYIGSIMIGSAFNMQPRLTLGMIIFAVGTSTTIGLVFGVYPAYQAAKLDPVESLRDE